MKRSWGLKLVALCAGSAVAWAGEVSTVTRAVPLDDAKSVLVRIDFGAGDIDLGKSGEGQLLEGTFTSDPEDVEVRVDYRRSGDKGMLDLATDYEDKRLPRDHKNEWEVGLSGGVPLELELDLGAAEAKLDLTDLALTRLEMDVGAAKCEVWWNRPNPERLSEIKIDAGASSLLLEGLGHARFDHLRFEGGLGSFDLDFSGDWQASAEADLEIGLGELTLWVPRHIGVRIVTEQSMASVDVDHRFSQTEDGTYESDNYSEAKIKLDCFVEVGMGSLEVKTLPPAAP